jgi:hypothetical protein
VLIKLKIDHLPYKFCTYCTLYFHIRDFFRQVPTLYSSHWMHVNSLGKNVCHVSLRFYSTVGWVVLVYVYVYIYSSVEWCKWLLKTIHKYSLYVCTHSGGVLCVPQYVWIFPLSADSLHIINPEWAGVRWSLNRAALLNRMRNLLYLTLSEIRKIFPSYPKAPNSKICMISIYSIIEKFWNTVFYIIDV